MTRFDFTPLFRSSIGFDNRIHLLDSLDDLSAMVGGYPPYDIERLDENRYRISIAVAGFAPEDLQIEMQENALTVSGAAGEDSAPRSYIHRGIADRTFARTFQLADHVRIMGARLNNGLLQIDFVQELPKEKQPRRIEIETGAPLKIADKAKKLVQSLTKAA